MWLLSGSGWREYLKGQSDWSGAADVALQCVSFREDVEEECVADEVRSCYNCRYRRWTENSFLCLQFSG
ncbi:MAG: hypothetical protein WCA04_07995 [Geobacteraceae bacterium]